MSVSDQDPDAGVAIRREAAAWVARMQGEDAERHRPALERWLAADPEHLAVYNRVTARFADAKILRTSGRMDRAPAAPIANGRGVRLGAVAVLAGLIAVAGIGALVWPRGSSMSPASFAQARHPQQAGIVITTRRGEIRTIALADGSRVTLDTGSALIVDFSDALRGLRLTRGRARFAVAHEARPFVVSAGGQQVTARGTLFDVEIGAGGGIRVALVQGVVDVGRIAREGQQRPAAQRLVAGEQLVLPNRVEQVAPEPLEATELAWPEGMTEIDDVPLADLLARANRYSSRPLVLADAALGTTRLSGRFRVNTPRRLADNLAHLLDLEVRDTPDRILLTRPEK